MSIATDELLRQTVARVLALEKQAVEMRKELQEARQEMRQLPQPRKPKAWAHPITQS